MPESLTVVIIIIAVSLIFSAFFSGMEIAFVSANRLMIAINNQQGGIQSRILGYFANKPGWFIGAMLLGNNIMVVIYSIFMASIIEPYLNQYLQSGILVLLIQTVIATLVLLVFAEFLPKAIFRINPNRTLSALAIPLFIIYLLLFIPTFITIGLAEGILKIFIKNDGNHKEGVAFEKVDLDRYLEEGINASDNLEEQDSEVKIFHNALNFAEVKARDCMIPRNEIIALEINEPLERVKQKFIQTGLSKVIIYKENIDNIIGYVHSFEMFKSPENIKSALWPVSIIPETMSANNVLEELLQKNRSIAVVVDEFGGTAGMITMEDVIEEIFGEIEDEHDTEDIYHHQISDTEFEFSGRVEIDFINEKYGLNLPESEEYETLGGFITNYFQNIPEKGESMTYNDYELRVKEASQTKIEQVLVTINTEQ